MKVVVFTDGVSRGNPGPAAIGAIIEDTEGRVISFISEAIGRTTNNPVLASVVPDNSVWINRGVGQLLGLRQGQKVRLVNQDGVKSGPVRTRLTKRIRPDCVYMVHGFGHKTPRMRANGRGASDSELVTQYKTDPIMGGTGMFVNFVSVEAEV